MFLFFHENIKIELITKESKSKVDELIDIKYQFRNYNIPTIDENTNGIFAAIEHEVVGTLSLRINKLSINKLFKEELKPFKQFKLCEFTRLANSSNEIHSSKVLCLLFYCSSIIARYNKCEYLFIEVNPRHVGFYQKAFKFELLGEEKFNKDINAPSRLLYGKLDWLINNVKTKQYPFFNKAFKNLSNIDLIDQEIISNYEKTLCLPKW